MTQATKEVFKGGAGSRRLHSLNGHARGNQRGLRPRRAVHPTRPHHTDAGCPGAAARRGGARARLRLGGEAPLGPTRGPPTSGQRTLLEELDADAVLALPRLLVELGAAAHGRELAQGLLEQRRDLLVCRDVGLQSAHRPGVLVPQGADALPRVEVHAQLRGEGGVVLDPSHQGGLHARVGRVLEHPGDVVVGVPHSRSRHAHGRLSVRQPPEVGEVNPEGEVLTNGLQVREAPLRERPEFEGTVPVRPLVVQVAHGIRLMRCARQLSLGLEGEVGGDGAEVLCLDIP
mmetsp:Transcript_20068/g.50776  ORF Transcript_20068/g.50776 Transcript_20068/m.50776 type:complete len:288 (-) Transcript_20068:320-1183(-)